MNIAENSLNLLVARIAWAADIQKRKGVEVPDYDYTSGFNVQPRGFVFDLRERGRRGEVVERVWREGRGRDPMVEVGIL